MKIYLAGKIAKNDWRHDLVPSLRWMSGRFGAPKFEDGEVLWNRAPIWPSLTGELLGHDYVGPYFQGDDHGCGHAPGTHGNAGSPQNACIGGGPSRGMTAYNCYAAIDSCDVFFAWLGGADFGSAYGTLVELGYARALRKTIFIGTDRRTAPLLSADIDDLWFAFHTSVSNTDNEKVVVAGDPVDAVKAALERLPKPVDPTLRKLLESPLEIAFFEAWAECQPAELSGMVPQHKVTANGKNYRLDFALPDRKIAFEMDGRTYHDTDVAFIRDRRRDLDLELAGWRVHRFDGDLIRANPANVVAIAAKLAGAAA